MTSAAQENPAARDDLAYEHALGLTQGGAAARAERLMETDAGFAESVARWRAHFSEFDETARPAPAGAALWARIEGALGRPAPAARPAARGGAPWDRLGLWRGAALTAMAASLALGVALGAALLRRDAAPAFVAVLLAEDRRPMAVVNAYGDGRVELIPTAPIAVPPDRTLQVWTLWDRGRGPVSLAVTQAPRRLALGAADLPPTAPDQLFEITLEPGGGSPTGRPTGPILMKGYAARAL